MTAVQPEYESWALFWGAARRPAFAQRFPIQYWYFRHPQVVPDPTNPAPPGQMRLKGALSDPSVDPEALEQADGIARVIRPMQFTQVLSSPLQRAHTPACLMAGIVNPQLAVQKQEFLKEWDFGKATNRAVDDYRHPSPNCELAQKFPQLVTAWNEQPFGMRMPMGESLFRFYIRVSDGIKLVDSDLQSQANCRMLMLGHGYVGMAMLCVHLNIEFQNMFTLPLLDPLGLMVFGRQSWDSPAKLLFLGRVD